MGWLGALGAIGGAVANRVEDKVAKKYGIGGDPNAAQNPNQPQDPTQPPPTSIPGYAKYRAMQTPLGRAISGGVQRYRQPPAGPQIPSQETADAMSAPPMPAPVMDGSTDLAGVEPMAQGQMVTKPTVALLGERGPEAVVPMNGNPANKVSMPPATHGIKLPTIPYPHLRYRK